MGQDDDFFKSNSVEMIAWHKFESKIREMHQKDYLEYDKAASEYIKVVVQNLFLLNLGGITTIPLALFVGTPQLSVRDKIGSFNVPFVGL